MPPLPLLLLQLLVVLAASRSCGAALGRVGQPRAVGEIVAGLALGPSLLGAVAPAVQRALFPADGLAGLQTLSQLGVLLFLFVVGLQLDLGVLRHRARAAVFASHTSIAVPFVLGGALALALPAAVARGLAGPRGGPVAFALFLATALSITAFPVLAQIVAERGLLGTRLGTLAITAAAVDDVTAWCILAGIVAQVRLGSAGSALQALGGTALALGALVTLALAVRPLLARGAARWLADPASRGAPALAAGVALALAMAWASERAGVHALFGAFLAGTLVPRAGGVARDLADRLRDPVAVLLLPTFFAFTGLRTQVGLLQGGAVWLALGALLAVAVVGKIGGTALGARLAGEGWRDALALGALMNTRGLMALVVVTIGLEAGVISPTLFTAMVLVALVTTAMTTPLLSLLHRP